MVRSEYDSIATIGAAETLALAWQPRKTRPLLASVFALDARLSRHVVRSREPLVGQIALAWWRERLSEKSQADPAVAKLATAWGGDAADLVPLVDGWEELLGEPPLGDNAIERFTQGRGTAFAAVARKAENPAAEEPAMVAGRRWGAADLAFRYSEARDRERAIEFGRTLGPPARLSRSLRGIAVLDGLSARSLAREEPLLAGRGAALAALRLGMVGR